MTLIYFIPLILAAAWSIKYDRQAEFDDNKSHRYWLLYVILSLIAALGYALGGDKQQYLSEFAEYSTDISDFAEEIENGIVDRGQMPLWVTLNFFAKVLFDSFTIVQIIESFFVNFAVFYFFKKYTQHVFLTILLFIFSFNYFYFNNEIMREAIAIGICLFATEAYFKKRYIIAFFMVLIAMLFHVSAIVMFLFPFMSFRVTVKRFPFMILGAMAFWFVSNVLFTKIINALLGQEGALVTKVLFYSSYSSGGVGAFIIYTIIYLVCPFLLMHYGLQRGFQDKELIRRKERFMTMYLCIAIVVISFLPLVRFNNYLLIVYMCFTTDTIYTLFKEKKHFLSKIVCFCIFWGYSTFQFVAVNPNSNQSALVLYFPYTTILDTNFDRSERQRIHSIITDGSVDAQNQREVEL